MPTNTRRARTRRGRGDAPRGAAAAQGPPRETQPTLSGRVGTAAAAAAPATLAAESRRRRRQDTQTDAHIVTAAHAGVGEDDCIWQHRRQPRERGVGKSVERRGFHDQPHRGVDCMHPFGPEEGEGGLQAAILVVQRRPGCGEGAGGGDAVRPEALLGRGGVGSLPTAAPSRGGGATPTPTAMPLPAESSRERDVLGTGATTACRCHSGARLSPPRRCQPPWPRDTIAAGATAPTIAAPAATVTRQQLFARGEGQWTGTGAGEGRRRRADRGVSLSR